MWFERMPLEDWFDRHQYNVDHDIGESAVHYLTMSDLSIDLSSVALRYGHHTGRPELRRLIADQYEGLTLDHVVVTTGASEANFVVVGALLSPGDHIVVEHPNYPSLYEVPRSLGADVTLLRLRFTDGFRLDLDRLASLLRADTKLVTMTHPNNPTGSMITRAELESLIELVESRGAYLLFDETYRDMHPDPLPPAASLSDRAVSISTMSKVYGLPGLRIGWLATRDAALLKAVLAIREQTTITNNALGEEIAIRVLGERDQYVSRARAHISANKTLASDWIDSRDDLEWVVPEGGVVGLPRLVDHLDLDPETLYETLVAKYRTFTVPGRCFEIDNRHFRLGFGSTLADLREGLERLGRAIGDLAGGAGLDSPPTESVGRTSPRTR